MEQDLNSNTQHPQTDAVNNPTTPAWVSSNIKCAFLSKSTQTSNKRFSIHFRLQLTVSRIVSFWILFCVLKMLSRPVGLAIYNNEDLFFYGCRKRAVLHNSFFNFPYCWSKSMHSMKNHPNSVVTPMLKKGGWDSRFRNFWRPANSFFNRRHNSPT